MPLPTISKERLRRLAQLGRRKIRDELGLQLLEGPRLVCEGLAIDRVTELFVRKDQYDVWRERAGDLPLHALAASDLGRLADVRTPQEIIAVGPLPTLRPLPDLLGDHPRIVVLDAVQDPGNVGAIARSAYALGASAFVLLPGTADVTAPKVLRASAGSLLRLELGKPDGPEGLQSAGHVPVLPVVRGGRDIREVTPPDRWALVLGNEAKGTSVDLPDALRVTIPMASGAESLNVAAACAVILGRWI